MRILVVSSYPPRRCGIGAYARAQVERLRAQGHAVAVLSPPDGDGDLRAPFPGGAAFRRAAAMGGAFDRIVVHFQPALYFLPRRAVSKVATSASLLWLGARRGRKLEILVHEADRPVRWRPDYVLLRAAFRAAGRVSFHSASERAALERDYRTTVRSGLVAHVAPVAQPLSREEARERLGIANEGGQVFLCAGFLQPSKGFERAIDAIPPGARLFVVGSVRDPTPENTAYAADLARRAEGAEGVTLVDRYVPDEEFDMWVVAADWLVLPYRRSWSSGVLARAHAVGTPAVMASVGGLPEQAAQGDIVFEGDDGLGRALRVAAGSGSAGRAAS